nr:hypothetical protein [uncultured bacterium]
MAEFYQPMGRKPGQLCTFTKRPSTEQQVPRAKDALRNEKVVGRQADEASDKEGGNHRGWVP